MENYAVKESDHNMDKLDEICPGDKVTFYNTFEGRTTEHSGMFNGHYRDGLCEVVEEKSGLTWMVNIKDIHLPITLKSGNPNYEFKVAMGIIPKQRKEDIFKPATPSQCVAIEKVRAMTSYTRVCEMAIGKWKSPTALSEKEAREVIIHGNSEIRRIRQFEKNLKRNANRAATIAELKERRKKSREAKEKLYGKKMSIKRNLKDIKKVGF
jgi:hypothetical protein